MHLVCTGALTNTALLILLFPEVSAFIEQIVLMGGAIGSGNTNPCAEFNMQVSRFSPESSIHEIEIAFIEDARILNVVWPVCRPHSSSQLENLLLR